MPLLCFLLVALTGHGQMALSAHGYPYHLCEEVSLQAYAVGQVVRGALGTVIALLRGSLRWLRSSAGPDE